MAAPSYILGLDLGQAADFTALAILERTESAYAVRHLERYPLGTTYPEIVESVRVLSERPPLPGSPLVVDQTGVGRAVVDSLRIAGLACHVRAITITSGHAVSLDGFDFKVPKIDLVACLQMLLGHARLHVAESLPLASTLVKELLAFRVKVTPAGNEVYESWRERDHDDLVLAVALASWYAERWPGFRPGSVGQRRREWVPSGVFSVQGEAGRPPKGVFRA